MVRRNESCAAVGGAGRGLLRHRNRFLSGLALFAALGALLVPSPSRAAPHGSRLHLIPGYTVRAVPECGVVGAADETRPGRSTPKLSPTTVASGLAVNDFVVSGNTLYVLSGSSIKRYGLNGVLKTTIALPWRATGDLVVDSSGDLYVVHAPYDVMKLGPLGNRIYVKHFNKPVKSIFGHQSSNGWRLGVISSRTQLFNEAGRSAGHATMSGQRFAQAAHGDLVADNGRYVGVYNNAYHLVFHFGDSHTQNYAMPESAPLHFKLQGAAVRLSNGDFLVADSGRGIWLTNPRGLVRGIVPDAPPLRLTQSSRLQVVGSTLYVATGTPFSNDQSVSRIPLSQIMAKATAPTTPLNRLGFGAGITAARPGHYYPPNAKPRFRVRFDPWWRQLHGLSLRYSVQDATQVQGEQRQHWATVALTKKRLARGVAIKAPSGKPGPYQANILLRQGKATVAATCLHYGIAARSMRLNLKRLPGHAGAGGPDGARGVALADLMGSGADRIGLVWSHLLAANGTLNFHYYDPIIRAAYQQERKTGVPFTVQLGQGEPESRFVSDGTWGTKVLQIVRHYANEVGYWEAWNEPNITGYSATDYVNRILKPVYADVRLADPTAKVIGGTVVGIGNAPYWREIAAAGGFNYMNIAAIHPYPGDDRSLEEEGFANRFALIKKIAAAAGKPQIPFWVTELAWWSNGPANWYGQANNSARGELWFKAEGIPVWEYFNAQGAWGNSGQDFSAINTASGDVKPVMLALMNQHAVLGNRPFQGWVSTGIPDTYAQRYGSARKLGGSVTALWSDDLDTAAVVRSTHTATVTVVNEYGSSARRRIAKGRPLVVPVSGSVLYLEAPNSTKLTIRPLETYGRDLALQSSGAKAVASSSNPLNPPSRAIDGISSALGQGDFRSSPAWASGVGDSRPVLIVGFPKARRIDRAIVATCGIDSVQPGIRGFDVGVQKPNHKWVIVARDRGNFFTRTVEKSFKPVKAIAVGIRVVSENYSGYSGGAMPYFWPTDHDSLTNQNQPWYGPAIIRELQVYSPGRKVSLRH